MNIKTVAIIGAGVMGSDTALDIACYGYNVILKDLNTEILKEAEERIKQSFRMIKMMKKELCELKQEDVLPHIAFQTDYNGFENVDIVIENIVEVWESKKEEYKRLKEVCKPETLFAVNTSCISITKIGSLLPDTSKVIGTHFMNPVPMKKMVEVIRGFHTSQDTEDRITDFLKSLGKNPVVVNDCPGFVSNRLSHLFMNEAAFLVQDQVASPSQIDMIFKQGFGHKMGPLETADLIGLDTVVNSLNILYESFQDNKFRCCPLLKKMVDAGLLGKKSGKGFYDYK